MKMKRIINLVGMEKIYMVLLFFPLFLTSVYSSDREGNKITLISEEFRYFFGGKITIFGSIKNDSDKRYDDILIQYSFFNTNRIKISTQNKRIEGLKSGEVASFFITSNPRRVSKQGIMYAELDCIKIDGIILEPDEVNGFVKEAIDKQNKKIYLETDEAIKDGKITKEMAKSYMTPWGERPMEIKY